MNKLNYTDEQIVSMLLDSTPATKKATESIDGDNDPALTRVAEGEDYYSLNEEYYTFSQLDAEKLGNLIERQTHLPRVVCYISMDLAATGPGWCIAVQIQDRWQTPALEEQINKIIVDFCKSKNLPSYDIAVEVRWMIDWDLNTDDYEGWNSIPHSLEYLMTKYSVNSTATTSLDDIIKELQVIGPEYRGAGYPPFDVFAINESKFYDGLRPKYYDIAVTGNTVNFRWETQEDVDDVDSLIKEIQRALRALKKKHSYTKTIKCKLKIWSRDYGERSAIVETFTV